MRTPSFNSLKNIVFSLSARSLSIPRYLWLCLGIGLLIRFFLMALTAHNDALFIPWLSYPIQKGHWNIYDYLAPLQAASPGKVGQVIWASNPPLSYFTMAGWMFILRITGILNPAGWDFSREFTAWNLIAIPRMLFLTKTLYLAADISIWLFLRQMVNDWQKKVVDLIWLFSPVILMSAYIMGQTDILPTLCVVISLALAKKELQINSNKKIWGWLAMVSLGIGGGYKLWPLLLIPLWSILLTTNFYKRMGFIICGFIPFLLSILPYASSPTFQKWVLNGSASNFLNVNTQTGGQNLSLFIIAWGCIHLYLWFYQKKATIETLVLAAFAILFLLFVFDPGWEFYWLIWLMPFLTLIIAWQPKTYWLYVYICAYFLLYTLAGWGLGIELFIPTGNVFLDMYQSTVGLRELLFNGNTILISKVLTTTFSLFIVSGLGIFILGWKAYKTGIYEIQVQAIKYSEAIIPAIMLGIYLFTSIATSLFQLKIRIIDILNSLTQVISHDKSFFLFFLLLIIVIFILSIGMSAIPISFLQNAFLDLPSNEKN